LVAHEIWRPDELRDDTPSVQKTTIKVSNRVSNPSNIRLRHRQGTSLRSVFAEETAQSRYTFTVCGAIASAKSVLDATCYVAQILGIM
jgi:hypothetical protein